MVSIHQVVIQLQQRMDALYFSELTEQETQYTIRPNLVLGREMCAKFKRIFYNYTKTLYAASSRDPQL